MMKENIREVDLDVTKEKLIST